MEHREIRGGARDPGWRDVEANMTRFATSCFIVIAISAIGTPAALAQLSTYTAGGTHQCSGENDSGHTCIVSGSTFSTCLDATNSLQLQDCCPSTQVCERDRATGARTCTRGGKSVGFTLTYCIGGGRF
jgi:hypothetical protein